MNKQELEEKYGHLKEQFFALYYNQVLFRWNHKDDEELESTYGALAYGYESKGHLQLKPLASISEEEVQEAFNVQIRIKGEPPYGWTVSKFKDLMMSGMFSVSVADYVRSKGYALGFMGITVEEQIALGWCKVGTV